MCMHDMCQVAASLSTGKLACHPPPPLNPSAETLVRSSCSPLQAAQPPTSCCPASQAQPWSHDAEAFKRWKEGRTGWPLVDANMVRAEAGGVFLSESLATCVAPCTWC